MQNGKGRGCNVHIAPSPLCRAAYTEQALKAAVLTGTKQYVMLGAGMDSFAFREKKFLSKHRVWKQSTQCLLHFPNFAQMAVLLCLIIRMRISLMPVKGVCRIRL
ncbi:class I SAM-dependent methyltransferase [Butyribacter sp.]|uniref:class I SAM-dependent methyltransferase n=1 Tax=Butyribacter sp. TaxID=2822465 RepID=UPI002A9D81A2|nr:class I SAM-dependent methyltransferase [Butyribacter sp.]